MSFSQDKLEEEVDFEIIKEFWNKYNLTDESNIKARIILTKIFKINNNEYIFEFANPILVVSCPNNKKGEKNREPKKEDYDNIEKEKVEIKDSKEEWNEYKIINLKQTLKIKYAISTIQRLKEEFDKNGYPIYIINGAPAATHAI